VTGAGAGSGAGVPELLLAALGLAVLVLAVLLVLVERLARTSRRQVRELQAAVHQLEHVEHPDELDDLLRGWVDRAPAGPFAGARDAPAREVLQALARGSRRRVEALRQLADLAGTDPVTGLPGGAAFSELVASAETSGVLTGGDAARVPDVAVLHLGLDGFRRFNAEHGRAAGDAVLAEVARRLRGSTRGGDVLARLGGDEFAVLLREAGAAGEVAVRLLSVVAEPVEAGPTTRARIGASIGVAVASAQGPSLLRAAEQAKTAAKRAGGGCLQVWDPDAVDARRDDELAAARLARGLADELEVHYQPTVDLDSGLVTGVEALVRWRRDGELVPPDDFIGLAERHGLIAELGRRVLATAVRDAPALAEAAGHDLVVAVNVSGPQLEDPQLLPAVRAAVADIAPHRLVLEMTEGILVAEDEATQRALEDLVAAGAFLCVDDFGTGCATLAYLRRRPFSAFKIDRSYVRDIETDRRTCDLVEGLVLLAAATGMGLVAEGVETVGQSEVLRRMGAPTQQGFLHARPQSLDDVVASIRRLAARLSAQALAGS